MTDPFAEVVALLQPSLPFSKQASGAGSWRIDVAVTNDPLFCVILEGAVLMSLEGRPWLELQENDFVLVPAARDFTMCSVDGGPPKGQSVHTMLDDEMRHGDPSGPTDMRMLAGRLAFGSPDAGLLLSLLPELIHVRGLKRIATLVQLVRNEAQDDRPAREMVLTRLLEVLLIEALRAASSNAAPPGLLRGLADARLGSAIRCIHADPRHGWTVERLAREASMSRSVFFDRFRREVGVPPMEYLLSWRMALARNMLRRGEGGVKTVAETVGYGSASSFSVAFTRFVGVSPMQFARQGTLEAG
ncbi:putative transcriptional regulator [Aurantimonas manganoxydans SI85-9A1]|uniref:Putative transcriptional regulator n=1 Tax=Aurantimonas manganoxydans (strain ATCC BAA-1229 / DSM 21871 / SI85-9A1) TaxID=287752 RepID=Q1YGS7_AURMS|nr:AraC family transcriptional regulator [Aurantimonas manganoxydans]EAS49148.1 putative transcriptional regulator [Aurantimonas manganoxydans SI85-9A1]